jgi:hypothetical protein
MVVAADVCQFMDQDRVQLLAIQPSHQPCGDQKNQTAPRGEHERWNVRVKNPNRRAVPHPQPSRERSNVVNQGDIPVNGFDQECVELTQPPEKDRQANDYAPGPNGTQQNLPPARAHSRQA